MTSQRFICFSSTVNQSSFTPHTYTKGVFKIHFNVLYDYFNIFKIHFDRKVYKWRILEVHRNVHGDDMENIEHVKKELREELRAEMRQLRDELLTKYTPPPKPEVAEAEDVTEIAADLRKLVEERKEFAEYVQFNPENASEILKPLANNERLKILQALYSGGKYFTDLVEVTGLEHSPLRFHLSSLMDAGYAEQERYRGRYLITVQGKIALRLVGFLLVKKGDINER